MSKALVTVVVTNYNYERYVAEAIESALNQTHEPLEVVVVDDGSTDHSREVIRRYPVSLVEQANRGLPAARNNGARCATGDYLMFLDADDVLAPNYVARCLEAFKTAPPRIAYVYTKMQLFGDEDTVFESRSFDGGALLRGNYIHASALTRTSVFREAGGYDETWRRAYEDYELWMRLLSLRYEGIFVPEPLLRYRKHGPSMISMSRSEQRRLKWRMRGTYPSLYYRMYLTKPLGLLKLLLWIGRVRYIGVRKARSDRARMSRLANGGSTNGR